MIVSRSIPYDPVPRRGPTYSPVGDGAHVPGGLGAAHYAVGAQAASYSPPRHYAHQTQAPLSPPVHPYDRQATPKGGPYGVPGGVISMYGGQQQQQQSPGRGNNVRL
ncbi:hypothetical protein IWQ56_006697, partial [Coemansia nantahalensis]